MCTGSRGLAFSAAVVSTIQSAISVGFGIIGLLLYSCTVVPPPPEDPQTIIPTIPDEWTVTSQPDIPTADDIISFITSNLISYTTSPIYYQYFHSQENCKAENVEYWANVTDFPHAVVATSSVVNGFFIGYVIENALWLLSSLLLFFGAILNSKCLYISFASTMIGVLMYDIVLVIIFGLDIGMSMDYEPTTILETLTKETVLINTILMMVIFARLVIFFIINIVLLVIMRIAVKISSKPKAKQVAYAHYY